MTVLDKRVGFIGAGNMAQSIIGGMIKNGWDKSQIIATAPTEQNRQAVHAQFGIEVFESNVEAAKADVIVLCVKPGLVKPVLEELAPAVKEKQPLLISVAAGVTMACLEQWVRTPLAIIRSMPNTPALMGFGASGLYANDHVSVEQKVLAESIFNAVGISEWVAQETLIDAVIAVSGSGPAYYFLFMEAMKDAGIQLGLSSEVSEKLTLQTALGAANMAINSDVDIAELRRRVCSPGGTTEQAVQTFQQGGLDKLVDDAMCNAVKRAKQMADELGK